MNRRWWHPCLVYHNPRERAIEPSLPWGKWNLYIGGAGAEPEGWLNVDLLAAPGVHVRCDAGELPFRDESFTRVECDAVLEHVPDVARVISEIYRCLIPCGVIHFVVPFCHPLHEYPKDYHRFTPDEIRRLCRDFHILDQGWLTGPTATILVFIVEFAKLWFRPTWAKRLVHFCLGWIISPLRLLDHFFFRHMEADKLGNHYFIYARKPLRKS